MCLDDEPNFSLGRIECRLFHLIYRPWAMHALTLEVPLTTASKERLNGLLFSIESDDQPVFLVSLPGLLQKASECLVRPLTFVLRVVSKSSMPPSRTIALTSNKKSGVDCKTSAHRSSVPWTPEENAKNSYEEHDPQRPIAHSLRECGLSIFNAFDMPRFSNPCRDSKYHRYDFEFREQSPVNNKQINDTSIFMRHSTRRKTRM